MPTQPQTESVRSVPARVVDDEDEAARRLGGWIGYAVTTLCCALALLGVKQVFH